MSGLNAASSHRARLRAKAGDPQSDGRLTPTRRADGPSACPCDSSRGPGGVDASDNSRSVMQQAAKSIRVRNAGVEPPPRLVTCRVPSRHMGHVLLAHGAAGAVKRPVVPHAPWGREGKKRPANPEPE